MDAVQYLQLEFDFLRQGYSELWANITDEELNWTPPGTANSIGVNLLHALAGEDMFVQQLILGKPTVWVSQEWSKKTGLTLPPGGDEGWQEARQARLQAAQLAAFEKAVCQETAAFLATLTPEALDRPVNFFGSPRPLAFLLAIIVFHSFEHMGEASALKGVQTRRPE